MSTWFNDALIKIKKLNWVTIKTKLFSAKTAQLLLSAWRKQPPNSPSNKKITNWKKDSAQKLIFNFSGNQQQLNEFIKNHVSANLRSYIEEHCDYFSAVKKSEEPLRIMICRWQNEELITLRIYEGDQSFEKICLHDFRELSNLYRDSQQNPEDQNSEQKNQVESPLLAQQQQNNPKNPYAKEKSDKQQERQKLDNQGENRKYDWSQASRIRNNN